MEGQGEVIFLRKLQRLLDEGKFDATYKFALLQALADLSIESPDPGQGPLTLSLEQIAVKFVEYYWRQVVPYRSDTVGLDGRLKHRPGAQAAVVTRVLVARQNFGGSLARAQGDTGFWKAFTQEVAGDVYAQPLWKLQTVAGESDEFLYRRADYAGRKITLLPGVASHFRSFYGLVTRLVRSSWVDQIRAIRANQPILGDSPDLDEFLFGTERQGLDPLRPILRETQRSRCFYCEREVRGAGEVDHFIPWSRYSTDLGHNFVLAHPDCNRRKSDFLAHPDHLAHWSERNTRFGPELSEQFREVGFQHDLGRSLLVAEWAYEQGEKSGAHVWLLNRNYVPLTAEWRRILQSG